MVLCERFIVVGGAFLQAIDLAALRRDPTCSWNGARPPRAPAWEEADAPPVAQQLAKDQCALPPCAQPPAWSGSTSSTSHDCPPAASASFHGGPLAVGLPR